jgi:hypothetical protein
MMSESTKVGTAGKASEARRALAAFLTVDASDWTLTALSSGLALYRTVDGTTTVNVASISLPCDAENPSQSALDADAMED